MMTDAERLERYDRLYTDLLAERERVTQDMARLREDGKTKTATHRQLIAAKLTLQDVAGRFERYGIEKPTGCSPDAD